MNKDCTSTDADIANAIRSCESEETIEWEQLSLGTRLAFTHEKMINAHSDAILRPMLLLATHYHKVQEDAQEFFG